MKKLALLILSFALLLASCGGGDTTPKNQPGEQAAQLAVENIEVTATLPATPTAEAAQPAAENKGPTATLTATPTVEAVQPAADDKEVEASVPDNPKAEAAQAIMENWIVAYETKDPDALLSLWSDDFTWTACATSSCATYYLQELKYYVPSDFKNPKFKVEVQSYLITRSGDFAIVQALYTDSKVGVLTPTPAVAILGFEDGKIASEKWYW